MTFCKVCAPYLISPLWTLLLQISTEPRWRWRLQRTRQSCQRTGLWQPSRIQNGRSTPTKKKYWWAQSGHWARRTVLEELIESNKWSSTSQTCLVPRCFGTICTKGYSECALETSAFWPLFAFYFFLRTSPLDQSFREYLANFTDYQVGLTMENALSWC